MLGLGWEEQAKVRMSEQRGWTARYGHRVPGAKIALPMQWYQTSSLHSRHLRAVL